MIHAYVLHSIPYKETSLIIKFFTREHGIVHLVARGIKRKKKYLSAILQPFVPLLIHWKYYTSELATLYQAEASNVPHQLIGLSLFGALYINELLIKLLAIMDPYSELFDSYKQFLEKLKDLHIKENQADLEKHLRTIEKKILKAIGYELQLDRESQTNISIKLNEKYYFDFDNGLQRLEKNSVIFTQAFNGASLLALHNDIYSNEQERKEAKLFMRNVLAKFLGKQSLNTKKLFH